MQLGILAPFIFCLTFSTIPHGDGKAIHRCSGKVVDINGNPVVGASVSVYRILLDRFGPNPKAKWRKVTEITTDTHGQFTSPFLQSDPDEEVSLSSDIIASKKGLALGWESWDMAYTQDNIVLTLQKSTEVGGQVVDNNGKPIAGAEVGADFSIAEKNTNQEVELQSSISFIEGIEELKIRTDANGWFCFSGVPTEALVDFVVTAPKWATTDTFHTQNDKTRGYPAGKKDIRIVMQPEGRIEGVAVETKTGKPVAGVVLAIERVNSKYCQDGKIVQTDKNGHFSIAGLASGRYFITSTDDPMADWLSVPVGVTVETGKTASGVILRLNRGSILEVLVKNKRNHDPIPNMKVSITSIITEESTCGRTDKTGICRMRLWPGSYQIDSIFSFKHGYCGPSETPPNSLVTLEEDKILRKEIEYTDSYKVRGVAMDETGKPVMGAKVSLLWQSYDTEPVLSDANGKFELIKEIDERYGIQEEETDYLVVRHFGRNLAGVVSFKDAIKPIKVILTPGFIISGKVNDEAGRPIPKAKIRPILRTSLYNMNLDNTASLTDTQGNYVIKAIPANYDSFIGVDAKGYGGQSQSILKSSNTLNITMATIVLPLIDQTLSGKVIDIHGNPVDGAEVRADGYGQPYVDTITDLDGKFVFKVCKGSIHIYVNVKNVNAPEKSEFGSVVAKGGDTNIVITVKPPLAQ